MEFEAVIGLEIHAQVNTKTKIFCGCSTEFGAPPNSHVCPVCLGLPGALPVLNRDVVASGIKAALSLNCSIDNRSVFARKNYFYPDLPKGYQISQFELPYAKSGYLDIKTGSGVKRIGVTRIHFEEDAGKNVHTAGQSCVDLNRAGVPLMEIVSEPDIRSSEEAAEYMRTVHAYLVWINVCDGNMDQGSFRCDANISLRPVGQEKFGTRAELKNLNSFKFVQKAIDYEIKRQRRLLLKGEKIVQETRLYDSVKNITESMRAKEDSDDYRYFPEPDLRPLDITAEWVEKTRLGMPEMPNERLSRFVEQYDIPEYDASVLTGTRAIADYFEEANKGDCSKKISKKISNWIMTELMRELKKDNRQVGECMVTPSGLASLVTMIDSGQISGKIAKTVFEEAYKTGKAPKKIVEEKGLAQISDTGALETMVKELIANNPKEKDAYLNGKKNIVGFFVGEVMKKTRGKANPKIVNQLIGKILNG